MGIILFFFPGYESHYPNTDVESQGYHHGYFGNGPFHDQYGYNSWAQGHFYGYPDQGYIHQAGSSHSPGSQVMIYKRDWNQGQGSYQHHQQKYK